MEVMRGDVFCAANPQSRLFGVCIKFFEKIHSKDNEAIYTHSGIITGSDGGTIEALMTIKRQNIFKDYAGQRVIVARPTHTQKNTEIPPVRKSFVMGTIESKYEGRPYPGWRLAFFIAPPIAKYIHCAGMPVCSELTAMYLGRIKARYEKAWWGVMPDTLADEWSVWKNYDVIFEGVMPKNKPSEGDD